MANSGSGRSANSNGVDGGTRQSRVGLAAYFRGRFPMALLADMYVTLLMGKMFKVVKVDECDHPPHAGQDCTCGLSVEEDTDSYDKRPTIDHMILVIARIMERSYGMPAQHVHVEQEIRAELTAIHAGIDLRYLDSLPPQALDSIRGALRNLNAAPKDPVSLPLPNPDDDVEDAEFMESVEKYADTSDED